MQNDRLTDRQTDRRQMHFLGSFRSQKQLAIGSNRTDLVKNDQIAFIVYCNSVHNFGHHPEN